MSAADRFRPVTDHLEALVAAGTLPGWSLALRHRGEELCATGGRVSLAADAVSVDPGTPFRLASLTKPFAGALVSALVATGRIDLDADVTAWAPELGGARVLRDPAGPLDDTVQAERHPTVRDLLTMTPGFGATAGGPLATALDEAGVGPSAMAPALAPDVYLARLGALPLAAQPGARWRYHLASDVLGVVLERATGRPLPDLLAEHVLDPVGATGTAFEAPATRLGTAYMADDDGVLQVLDPPDGAWSRPPRMHSLAAGLVAPAGDVLALLTAVADGTGPLAGRPHGLAVPTVTPEQTVDHGGFLDTGTTWGSHVGVVVGDGVVGRAPGSWGWDGGTGTTGWVDPGADLAVVLLTARGWFGDLAWYEGSWRLLAECARR